MNPQRPVFRALLSSVLLLVCFLAGGFPMSAMSDSPNAAPLTPAQLQQELRSFREMSSVLHVGAHPDDENTQLIAYLARGRGLRTAYLSLTRGDGGQNALSGQLGELLGIARTQELLAARRIDRGQQFFTRARDFGFSKDYRETMKIWDRQQVLADTVRVIRYFQPDVIITRFSPQPSRTHGHHTSSAILALEAFKLAADPNAFPEQLKELKPWQAKRIVHNQGRRDTADQQQNSVQLDIAGVDPVTQEPFGTIAALSLSMHKTQGLTTASRSGGATGAMLQTFQLLDGAPMQKDLLDGVEQGWLQFPGGEAIDKMTADLVAKFEADNPAASVPALLELRARLAALPTAKIAKKRIIEEKRRQLDRILQTCLGLSVTTRIPQPEALAGDTLRIQQRVTLSANTPVTWTAVRYPALKKEDKQAVKLTQDQPATRESAQKLPADMPLTQPYWLRAAGTVGMFRVDEQQLIGRPENPPAFPVEYVFQIGDQTLVLSDVPGTADRELQIVPPASLRFVSEVELFAPSATRPVTIEITAMRDGANGNAQLTLPPGWKVTPVSKTFALSKAGDKTQVSFDVTAPAKPATAQIAAHLQIGNKRYDSGRVEIQYEHIPFQLLQSPAGMKAVSLELNVRGKRIGYFQGAGDDVAASLAQMGYEVTELQPADLTHEKLKTFDAVVLGVRAFNTRAELLPKLPALYEYAAGGGTVIAQYTTTANMPSGELTPYPLSISNERVTDETATMTFLAPEHPALNVPNKITAADFDGWVQERGLYFPSKWDDRYTPIFACNDEGEQPSKGSLLIAQHGKGYFVYTGLAFFRQLPAGVPGAYRLFANLLSLGK